MRTALKFLAAAGLLLLTGFSTPVGQPLHVPTNTALTQLSTLATTVVTRDGFAAAGDMAPQTYIASASACPLNGGNGDNGSQVKSANNKCWLALQPTYGSGTAIKVYGPTHVANGVFGTPTNFWTVVMPDGTQETCTATQANCLDNLFTSADVGQSYYNFPIEIEQQGGLAGDSLLAINTAGPLKLPAMRSRYFLWKGINAYAVGTSANTVMQIDSLLNSDLWFMGGQLGANAAGHNYTNVTLSVKPQNTLQSEGFIGVVASNIHLPALSHDANPDAVFTGSIGPASTTMNVTAFTSGSLAVGQVVGGSGVLNNTQITACPGGGCGVTGNFTVSRSQTVGSETLKAYTQANSVLAFDSSLGNIITTTVDGTELNGAGADNTPRTLGVLNFTSPTATTGTQDSSFHFSYLHNCSAACVNMGLSSTNAGLFHGNTLKLDQVSPGAGTAGGASDWGHDNIWNLLVDDTIGVVNYGMVLQSSSHHDVVNIKCKGNISGAGINSCLIIASGSVNNRVYVETEGTVTSPVVDNNAGAGNNLIYVNGKLFQQPWTPVLKFGGAAPVGITYAVQTGTFTFDGGQIVAPFNITLTNKGAQVGAATVTGLPYAGNITFHGGCTIGTYANFNAAVTNIVGDIAPTASAVTLNQMAAGATAAITDAGFLNTSVIDGVCTYLTN